MFIEGTPAPQGSKNAYQRGGRIVLVEASKNLKPWREKVRAAFIQAAADDDIYTMARIDKNMGVGIYITFHLEKPKTVKRLWPTVKPDLDKLVRAILDAGTGVLWIDDAQVRFIEARKVYAVSVPGVYVNVHPMNND
jgi:crossover junction endodeoxyribonuclease RusA